MSRSSKDPHKPKALREGSRIALFAASSPAEEWELAAGISELTRLGFRVTKPVIAPEGYFAAPTEQRKKSFVEALKDGGVDGLIALRGGYGATYLLSEELPLKDMAAKAIVGYSDVTALQAYLWQKFAWVTFYGPMVAAGFGRGLEQARGYDEESFLLATSRTRGNWGMELHGETLRGGEAEGRLLGGCLTMLQTTLGTPWELETAGAILALEDVSMRPYQIDRALMHLQQAGKFKDVRGIVLGEFPNCEAAVAGSPTVREVCERILRPLGVPVTYGAPIGHAKRAMLTLPLGVRARLNSAGTGRLEILEPAVVE